AVPFLLGCRLGSWAGILTAGRDVVVDYQFRIKACLRAGCPRLTNEESTKAPCATPMLPQDKPGRGGKFCSSNTETFQRNPAGNQARPVELGQRPEASLAWGGSHDQINDQTEAHGTARGTTS